MGTFCNYKKEQTMTDTQILEDLEFYSIRENFLYESLYEYLPEAKKFMQFIKPEDISICYPDIIDQTVYSMKLIHFLVYANYPAWPIFLELVEKGLLLLEEKGLIVTGDVRLIMLLAVLVSGE